MGDREREEGVTRQELMERVAMMESMISEGRRATCRNGWIFVLWGLLDLAALGWQWESPGSPWTWPVTIAAGIVLQLLGLVWLRRRSPASKSLQARSVGAVWSMMGVAITLYVAAALICHLSWQISYLAGILMMIGMAHAISALILRWRVQGVVAALWWAGGAGCFFLHGMMMFWLMVAEMFFGMVLFGLYVMLRERQGGRGSVASHA